MCKFKWEWIYAKQIAPRDTRGVLGCYSLGGQQFKSMGKLSDWHQLWFTSADSSGNGYIHAKQIALRDTRGALGGFRGSNIKSLKSVKPLDRLAPTVVHVCGFIWEWTKAKNNSPHDTPRQHWGGGGLGGQQFKSLENVVKRLDRLGINVAHLMQVNLGMDTGWTNWPHETPGGAFWRVVK